MRNPEPSLPIRCPHCHHDEAAMLLGSRSILTVTCKGCQYTWAIELEGIPAAVRRDAQVVMLERDFSGQPRL